MKTQLNEIKKLQKIAGLLKEDIQEVELTIDKFVKQLNKIANSKGFYAVDKSSDEKPKKDASGVKNLVKWEDDDQNSVELYYNNYGHKKQKIGIEDLSIAFESDESSGTEPADMWLNPDRWDETFSGSSEDGNDPFWSV